MGHPPRRARRPLLFCLPALAALALLVPAAAQPSLPATFYGSATVDGASVSAGTPVRAFVNGRDCSQPGPPDPKTVMDGAVSAYAIIVMHESQEPGCAKDGDTITFTIGGREATQKATWRPAPQRLDLNAGSGQPQPLPTATPTATPGASQAAATATARANPSATAVPPTDDIELPRTPQPGGAAVSPTAAASGTPAATPDDPEGEGETRGFPVLGTILGALILIAACGVFGGYMLARRSKGTPPPAASQ